MPLIRTKDGNEIDALKVLDWLHFIGALKSEFVIEKPVGSKSAKAAKSMAASFATIVTIFRLRNQVLHRIAARDWQKKILKCASGDTKPAALAKAKELWPDETWLRTEKCSTPDMGMVDAALIAHFWITK